jgi:hypothetical protein
MLTWKSACLIVVPSSYLKFNPSVYERMLSFSMVTILHSLPEMLLI